MFLDAIRIYVACGGDELRPLVLACTAGAATRYDTLQPCLTHIVVCPTTVDDGSFAIVGGPQNLHTHVNVQLD